MFLVDSFLFDDPVSLGVLLIASAVALNIDFCKNKNFIENRFAIVFRIVIFYVLGAILLVYGLK